MMREGGDDRTLAEVAPVASVTTTRGADTVPQTGEDGQSIASMRIAVSLDGSSASSSAAERQSDEGGATSDSDADSDSETGTGAGRTFRGPGGIVLYEEEAAVLATAPIAQETLELLDRARAVFLVSMSERAPARGRHCMTAAADEWLERVGLLWDWVDELAVQSRECGLRDGYNGYRTVLHLANAYAKLIVKQAEKEFRRVRDAMERRKRSESASEAVERMARGGDTMFDVALASPTGEKPCGATVERSEPSADDVTAMWPGVSGIMQLACVCGHTANQSLFPVSIDEKAGRATVEADLGVNFRLLARSVSSGPFFGKMCGFMYDKKMRKMFTALSTVTAGFYRAIHGAPGSREEIHVGEVNGEESVEDFARQFQRAKRTSSLFVGAAHALRYYVRRGRRASALDDYRTKAVDVQALRLFWGLPERSFVHGVFKVTSLPHMSLVRVIPVAVRPGAPLTSDTVRVRVLRRGRAASSAGEAVPVLFHIHGGGFVAQTSKGHEVYLRYWAKQTGATIVSVDYSLAPEAKYPIAHEETYRVYHSVLAGGVDGVPAVSRIVVAGDSAGGNLAAALVLRLIAEKGRVPDGLVLHYPALFIVQMASPARAISLLDPLLATSVLFQCLDAYVAEEHDALGDFYLSPLVAPQSLLNEFPRTFLSVGDLDPLYDDAIAFASRLAKTHASSRIVFRVRKDLPHGYLHFGFRGGHSGCRAAVSQAGEWIRDVLTTEAEA